MTSAGSPPEERTPLLAPQRDAEATTSGGEYQTADAAQANKAASHQTVYNRFSRREKYRIVTLVAFTGLMPLFVSGSFIPSIPQMALDLNSTAEVISLAVSISIMSTAFGTLFWATYSGFYGRRKIYLSGLPLVFVGSLGVGASTTVTALMCWRVVQAFGSAGGLSLGAGVIGDIYKLEERGTAMGIFFSVGRYCWVRLSPLSLAVSQPTTSPGASCNTPSASQASSSSSLSTLGSQRRATLEHWAWKSFQAMNATRGQVSGEDRWY